MQESDWRPLNLRPTPWMPGRYHGILESFTQFDGTVIEAGSLVWAQMYSPNVPTWDCTLDERIAGGSTYGRREMMLLKAIAFEVREGQSLVERAVKFCMFRPDRPNDDSQGSWPHADWCYLEPATREGMLW